MADITGIINAALGELGEYRIESFDDESNLADLALRHYDEARDSTLELFPWHFSCVYQSLTRLATAPAFRWAYQYSLPTDPYCLKVLETDKGSGTRWEIGAYSPAPGVDVQRVLFSNEPTVKIAYTARIEDVGLWTPLAIQVLIKVLASKLARPLTGQQSVEQAKWQEALALLPQALTSQVREGDPSRYRASETSTDLATIIAQQALSEIGHTPLVDILEETEVGFACRLHLATARDAVLQMHPWNFAKRQAMLRVPLDTLGDEILPAFKWGHKFLLPPGVLTILGTDLSSGDRFERAVDEDEGSVLYSDAEAVFIEYIHQETNYALWSALARQVLSKMLASQLVLAIAHLLPDDRRPTMPHLMALKQRMWEEARALLPEAQAHDAREGYPVQLRPNNLLLHARGGRVMGWR